jgi:hypothetical protein
MNLFVIEDKLSNGGNNYFFYTEHINNFITSKIFIADDIDKIMIKEIKKAIGDINSIKDEMMDFHNKILSNFFKALRNGDKNPENSFEHIESQVELETINNENNLDNKLENHINNLLNSQVMAILVANTDSVYYSINNSINTDISSHLKLNMDFSYKMMSSKKDSLYKSIGDIKSTIFSYSDYQIFYYGVKDTTIIVVVSSDNRLASSIKISNIVRDDILSFLTI